MEEQLEPREFQESDPVMDEVPTESELTDTPDMNSPKPGLPGWVKIGMIVNGIVLLALIGFGAWYFTSGSEKQDSAYPIVDKPAVMGLKIAYINNDSLTENYELVKEARRMLEEKKNRMELEIKAEQKTLEGQYQIWEKNVKEQKFSEMQLRSAQEVLMKKEQDLYRKSQSYTEQLAQEEMDRNEVFIDSVLNYLKRFNEVNRYDFIFNYASGATILLANDTFDITNVVLQGLNEEWNRAYPKKK